MNDELFDLVALAHRGDKDAMMSIINRFTPVINSVRCKTKYDRQDDLVQNIIELLIKKIMAYDLTTTLDFTAFCKLRTAHMPDTNEKM
ncbi:helix-turn-helix domain-containing protein [Paenibacillus sp. SC116]|uniref:helix-turn-helix domain-containing protein n=1 Tax=Paenibacillus sp. SC116 TaxID=2968986 RepID=UPI00215A9004|nr:helix-turn-helix domain-containing protein [Paenibacillus sp. SC116]MCR8845084.1 helix-turn-helix domain-containing protein [Paenibacillus sp. SC116]